jgi:predicted PurR-regulated permease PerM
LSKYEVLEAFLSFFSNLLDLSSLLAPWGWIWGVAGALLAVPLLAMLKIICHHFDALAPLAEFLGGESRAGSLS